MRYGIFSDIHGNLPAFEAVLAQLSRDKVDRYLCAGDVVGYGANPRECIDLMKGLNAPCVAGNHDWGAVGKTDIANFNPVAKEAILWTGDNIQLLDQIYLNQLELIFINQDLQIVHSLLPHPERFDYLTELDQATEMFPLLESDICFIGHTHVPQIFIQNGDEFCESDSLDVTLDHKGKYIVNVGSVGQPRDGNPFAAYCIYDSGKKTVTIHRVPYDIPEAQRRITAAGLPEFLARRLAAGK